MCFGSSGPQATITEPDYKAYDKMAKNYFKAMQKAQDKDVIEKGGNLARALQQEEAAYSRLRDLKVQEANNISSESARIAALLGTRPPDKGATAPVLGRDRRSARGSGGSLITSRRGSLRLGPLSPPPLAAQPTPQSTRSGGA